MPKLTVAYVSSYAYAGGVANDVRSQGIIDCLVREGATVHTMDPSLGTADRWRRLAQRWPGLGCRIGVLTNGTGVREWLESLDPVPEVVWLYGLDPRFVRGVLKWARSSRARVVCDVVDWYEPSDMDGAGPKGIAFLTDRWSMPVMRRRASAVAVASKTLAAYFDLPGRPSEVLPAVIEANHLGTSRHDDGRIHLVYAGTPGRRDHRTIENIREVARRWSGTPLTIHLVGLSCDDADTAKHGAVHLVHHGRLPRAQVLNLVSSCHGFLLQRPADRRFARAGFPSKVAEALLLGTPVVSNLTSDLADHLCEGENAVVVSGESVEDLQDALTRLVGMSFDHLAISAAAQQIFSPRAALPAVRRLVGASL